jgi:hypothetical protein
LLKLLPSTYSENSNTSAAAPLEAAPVLELTAGAEDDAAAEEDEAAGVEVGAAQEEENVSPLELEANWNEEEPAERALADDDRLAVDEASPLESVRDELSSCPLKGFHTLVAAEVPDASTPPEEETLLVPDEEDEEPPVLEVLPHPIANVQARQESSVDGTYERSMAMVYTHCAKDAAPRDDRGGVEHIWCPVHGE